MYSLVGYCMCTLLLTSACILNAKQKQPGSKKCEATQINGYILSNDEDQEDFLLKNPFLHMISYLQLALSLGYLYK